MLKVRIIPILTFNGFALVKTKKFSNPRMVGNPVQAARVYNSRGVDELIFLDIFASTQNRKINLRVVKDVIKECFMPVGIGGGIRSLDDISNLLKIGADKVVIKTAVLQDPDFIKSAVGFFGSQCISVSIDVIKHDQKYFIYNNVDKNIQLEDYIGLVHELGAGEIILNNVDNDGMMEGFDLSLFNLVNNICRIPVVYVGGAGNLTHFEDLFEKTSCNAVGASSLYHFTQYTPSDVKRALSENGINVRM
jgi:cyclase